MNDVLLNLARTWRSKTFDEIIGQDLAIRLAKNSLYRGQLFPVYLLAGQRGCGKTTMGRVFAAAINCQKVSDFQQQPQTVSLPCLTCQSCHYMRNSNHPDFIEIDAASNTGVDNVRALIEAASYMPVIGRKKIYLIDEAHMLSKAAFNAFLKILEEPPVTALFMLATTDIHKIIDTVRSRCFHLFFQPVAAPILIDHLQRICQQEHIIYDLEGLQAIVQESEGSVRDAINLIERVRLAYDTVTKDTVSNVLGMPSDDTFLIFFQLLAQAKTADILNQLRRWYGQGYQPRALWKRLVDLLRACLLVQNSVDILPHQPFALHVERLRECAQSFSLNQILQLLAFCYEIEPLMSKSTAQETLVEMLIIKMATLRSSFSLPSTPVMPIKKVEPTGQSTANPEKAVPQQVVAQMSHWETFLATLEKLNDPLICSMFKQGKLISWQTGSIVVLFPAKFVFFKEMLATTEHVWKAIMAKIAGCEITFASQFQEIDENSEGSPSLTRSDSSLEKKPIVRSPMPIKKNGNNIIDVQDAQRYPQAQTLLKAFPGTIYEKQDKNT
jgi:DNA polymerase-3 subunit gamma/tau